MNERAVSEGTGQFLDRLMADADKAVFRHSMIRTLLENAYEFIAPSRLPRFLGQSADDMYRNVYNSTPIEACDNLASTFVTGQVPAWFPWMQLTPGPLVQGEDRHRLRQLLEPVSRVLLLHLNLSNFYNVVQGFYIDYIMGTATLKIEPKLDGNGFQFTDMLAEQVAIEESASKRVSHHYICSWLKGWEILQHDDWVEKIQAAPGGLEAIKKMKEAKDELFEVLEANVPLKGDKSYHAIVLKQPKVLLVEKEQTRNPYITARWGRLANTPYGDGRGNKAYPDVRTLNKYVELILENAALSIAGMYTARHDNVLNPNNIVLDAGMILPVMDNNRDNPPLAEIPRSGELTPGLLIIRDLEQKVRMHFYDDELTQAATPKSATEIVEASQQKLTKLGAVNSRLEHEFLLPMVRAASDILIQQGILPKGSKIDRQTIDVEIRSNIAQAQRRGEIRDQLQFLQIAQNAAVLDPTVGALPDVRSMVRDIGETLNIRVDRTRSDSEIDKMAKQTTQAALALRDTNAAQQQAAG